MRIWAIVPVKPFVRAKSRLAGVLPAPEREALAESMFRHLLDALGNLTRTAKIAGVMVISRDSKALAIARDYGVSTVQESGAPELNAALLRASEVVRYRGTDGVLVLPADLPLVTAEDVEQIVNTGRYNATVVIVPDRLEDGTNAMLVIPPGFIPYSYGVGSFKRHKELAERAGATVKVLHLERLALDLDTPEDLAVYNGMIGRPVVAAGSLKE